MRISCSTVLFLSTFGGAVAFVPSAVSNHREARVQMSSAAATNISLDPKEAVKLFGRLAEKYIMLDDTGGMCCYSACKDCEYREPGGGYRMADQSASRPKWIPVYDERKFEAMGKAHTSKWSAELFADGPAVTKEEFVDALTTKLEYSPPLGGPYVSKSAAKLENSEGASLVFDLLAGDKEKLTKHRMSTRLRELSDGEEGITWASFQRIVGAE
eukprot:CAMPEP_0202495466 /NCGR_PEP_ID=MMETSP1361-20130828/16564_1 /ASSEMBLY_ACC=CAM_ASM_000849 /TAXON_ID=210615 /ORGANISM="Staurosira complex sp., Strain CCMP2646" /LENGTH=213 /DNA_ID=CAMNT_0049126497 /DNA_START=71 /DNA_END=712 /DNA_ORIENTATION=-